MNTTLISVEQLVKVQRTTDTHELVRVPADATMIVTGTDDEGIEVILGVTDSEEAWNEAQAFILLGGTGFKSKEIQVGDEIGLADFTTGLVLNYQLFR